MRPEGGVPSTTWFVLLSAIGGLALLFDWALDHQELLVPRLVPPLVKPGDAVGPNGGVRALSGVDVGGDGNGPTAPPTSASAAVPGAVDERGDGTVGGEADEVALAARGATDPDTSGVAGAEARAATDDGRRDTAGGAAREVPEDDGASVVDVSVADEIDALRLLLAEAAVLGATPTRPGERAAWRPKELAILDELSGAIRFAEGSATPDPRTREILDHVADVLALHPDTRASVAVVGRERADARRDRVLRRERGRAVIAALVERGLAFSRLSLDVTEEDRAASGPHRIRVVVDEPDRRTR